MCKDKSGIFRGTKGDKTSSTPAPNKLPANESQLKHIFRNAEGHLPDTPENRHMITETANHPANYVGADKYGNSWFSKFDESDGAQIWVQTRNGVIQNAGKNLTEKTWDPETGYPKKNTNWRKRK